MTMKQVMRQTVLLIALVTLLVSAASCSKKSHMEEPSNVDYYTCTMHPSVHSKAPEKCPICSMDLVPVMKKGREAKPSASHEAERKIKYYKSTMMPGEVSGKPAKDSMGMDMAPVYEDERAGVANQPSEFVVPVERQQQIGVTYAKVERKRLRHTIRAVGLIVPDKTP